MRLYLYRSFDALCSRLESTAIKLQKMVLEGPFAERDTLVQLFVAAIQTLHTVYTQSKSKLKFVFISYQPG